MSLLIVNGVVILTNAFIYGHQVMMILFLYLMGKWWPSGFQGGDIQKENILKTKNKKLDAEHATRNGKMEMEMGKAHGKK